MNTNTTKIHPVVHVTVEPGICGFPCTIKAQKKGNRIIAVEITGSECKQVQRLATCLNEMTLKELFMPLTRNPVYIAAENSGCHPSCAIPSAVLKTAEVALGMALPSNVCIKFNHNADREKDRAAD